MKHIFLLLALTILNACASPQVTVTSEVTVTSTLMPTETPIPTLTPTPIAVDGIATIDGIHYIFDEAAQEWVALPELDAEFARVLVIDDSRIVAVDAGGTEVYALDMTTGEWEKLESKAMTQTKKLIETYTLEEKIAEGIISVTEQEGAVNVVDTETDTVLIRTIGEQSKYDLGFAVNTIAKESCEITPFTPRRSGGLMPGEYGQAVLEYVARLREEFGIPLNEASGKVRGIILLKRESACWGFVVNNDLLYRDENHKAQKIPLKRMTDEELPEFIVSEK